VATIKDTPPLQYHSWSQSSCPGRNFALTSLTPVSSLNSRAYPTEKATPNTSGIPGVNLSEIFWNFPDLLSNGRRCPQREDSFTGVARPIVPNRALLGHIRRLRSPRPTACSAVHGLSANHAAQQAGQAGPANIRLHFVVASLRRPLTLDVSRHVVHVPRIERSVGPISDPSPALRTKNLVLTDRALTIQHINHAAHFFAQFSTSAFPALNRRSIFGVAVLTANIYVNRTLRRHRFVVHLLPFSGARPVTPALERMKLLAQFRLPVAYSLR